MKIGKLRHRIAIQQNQSTTEDSNGNPVAAWTLVARVWADVMPLSGREALLAQQVNATTTHKIKIRYLASVQQDMRVSYDGRYFDINAVLNDRETDRMQWLECTENQVYADPVELTEEEENNLRSAALLVPISYYDQRHFAGLYRAEPS